MTFRTVIFWMHLVAGGFAGVVILTMSVTGVLLMYERQIVAWSDARAHPVSAPAPGAVRLPIDDLVGRVREAKGDAPGMTLTIARAPGRPAIVNFGRDGSYFVNPYTGDLLGEATSGSRRFFRVVTDWHRWLGVPGDSRPLARSITGASNLAFLFLVTSGFYLWFPRRRTRQQFAQVLWFRRGLRSRARDFNWHNVIGVWCAAPLFVVVASGVVISYPWASNLVYRLVGEQPPAPQRPGGETATSGTRQSRAATGDREFAGSGADGAQSGPTLDALWARAEQHAADWQTISLRLPSSSAAPAAFTIDAGNGGQPQKRAQLLLDARTGDVVRWEPFDSLSQGRRLRSVLRFAHTGEVAGAIGQTIAGLASAGAVFLVYTGLALCWRRLFLKKTPSRPLDAAVEQEKSRQPEVGAA